jgi:hypothetical protein
LRILTGSQRILELRIRRPENSLSNWEGGKKEKKKDGRMWCRRESGVKRSLNFQEVREQKRVEMRQLLEEE